MRFDEDYIYVETPEELSMFYGWDNVEELTENDDDELDWFKTDEPWVESFHISEMETDYPHKYRIPLPTVNDLKVGDVVDDHEGLGLMRLDSKDLIGFYGQTSPVSLLISRNTWVKVKV